MKNTAKVFAKASEVEKGTGKAPPCRFLFHGEFQKLAAKTRLLGKFRLLFLGFGHGGIGNKVVY